MSQVLKEREPIGDRKRKCLPKNPAQKPDERVIYPYIEVRGKREMETSKIKACRLDCVYLWVSGWVRVCGMNPHTYKRAKKSRNIFWYSDIFPRILAPYYSSYLKAGLLRKDYLFSHAY